MVKFIAEHVKDPLLIDDKTRINEYMNILENPESSIAYKCFALNGLGRIANTHGAAILDVYDAVPVIISELKSDDPIICFEAARCVRCITKHDGEGCVAIHLLQDVIARVDVPDHLKVFCEMVLEEI
jgi:hypothetical protein